MRWQRKHFFLLSRSQGLLYPWTKFSQRLVATCPHWRQAAGSSSLSAYLAVPGARSNIKPCPKLGHTRLRPWVETLLSRRSWRWISGWDVGEVVSPLGTWWPLPENERKWCAFCSTAIYLRWGPNLLCWRVMVRILSRERFLGTSGTFACKQEEVELDLFNVY